MVGNKIKNIFVVIFSVITIFDVFSQGGQPEIYTRIIHSLTGETFTIRATAQSIVYDKYYNYTSSYQTAQEVFPAGLTLTGFDFCVGLEFGYWEVLGYGRYKFEIYSSINNPSAPFFYFYIDFRKCFINFLDLEIIVDKTSETQFIIYCRNAILDEGGEVTNGQELNYWDLVPVTEDDVCFSANILPHNYVPDGSEGFDDFGELYIDDVAYTSGVDLFTTLKGNTHNFRSYTYPVGTENYLFRNWNSTIDHYLNPKDMRVENNNNIESYLYPTQPLTLTNNLLDGGSGGSYIVTWDKQLNQPHTLTSSQVYNAFEYNASLLDLYTLTVNDFNAYNTMWFFKNWDNGSISKSRTEAITSTNKNFTANYKGNLVSNQSDGFTSNGQRKIVRDNSRIYHCVYSSLGKVWYTKSTTTNFDGTWTQDFDVFSDISQNAKNPSIDFKKHNIICNRPINT